MTKLEIDATLLATILATLAFQKGFIEGIEKASGKDFGDIPDFYSEMHSDILDLIEGKEK
jgi:hypothetical protein